ncbi:MAG: PRC-barrel domain-containing protein [Methanobacteriaceae archaeon]|nr:PRC-barrel domain-containing protein [Methanobacteriaceae archaeon]
MKMSKLIGKKVLDGNAFDLGKIQDFDMDIKEGKINSITITPNEISFKKVSMNVNITEISEVGDYVLLNINKSEIEEMQETKKEEEKVVNPDKIEKESKTININ